MGILLFCGYFDIGRAQRYTNRAGLTLLQKAGLDKLRSQAKNVRILVFGEFAQKMAH